MECVECVINSIVTQLTVDIISSELGRAAFLVAMNH